MAPYFVSYNVADSYDIGITAQFGALVNSTANHNRVADIVVRVGEPEARQCAWESSQFGGEYGSAPAER